MRAKVGILVNEVVLPLPTKGKSDFYVARPLIDAYVEITLFGQSQRTRNYRVVSPTSPILPCEQLYFSKEFFKYTTIADLLRSFEREPFLVRLFADHLNLPAHSGLRRELLAEYEDNALNVLYPYHTLHPSYDHLSRRLHLSSVMFQTRPVLTRLTLSVAISGDEEPRVARRRFTPVSADRRSSPSRPYAKSRLSHRPAYMEPTFSSLMYEHTTRLQFSSPSTSRLRTPDTDGGLSRVRRSTSDFLRREY